MARFAARVATVASVAVLLLAVAAPGVGVAQTTPATPATPFPRSIVAFPPASAAGTAQPALAIQTLAAADAVAGGSEGTRAVTVGFAAPFVLPAGRYRVSVVVGDPTGAQTRASLTATGGVSTGTLETSTDGTRWTAKGATRATFVDDSVTVDVPVGAASPEAAVWVEAEIDDDAAQSTRSPVYSLDALLGRSADGKLPATTWGRSTATPDAAAISLPGAAPTLSVDNQALIVDETAAAPTKVDGQAVVAVSDQVTFMPSYTAAGTVPGVVDINRTTGEVLALEAAPGAPVNRTGDGSWLVTGLPVTNPSAPGQVVIDLEGIATAFGFSLDAEATGIGLQRTVTLADGTVVVGSTVLGVLGWFQGASVPTEAAPSSVAPAATPAGGSNRTTVLVAAGGVALVLVLAAVVVTRVRRRRTPVFDGSAEPIVEKPVVTPVESEPEPVLVPHGERAAEPEPEFAERKPGGRSPEDALAAFDAQVSELIARADRLAPPDPATPPDGRRSIEP